MVSWEHVLVTTNSGGFDLTETLSVETMQKPEVEKGGWREVCTLKLPIIIAVILLTDKTLYWLGMKP